MEPLSPHRADEWVCCECARVNRDSDSKCHGCEAAREDAQVEDLEDCRLQSDDEVTVVKPDKTKEQLKDMKKREEARKRDVRNKRTASFRSYALGARRRSSQRSGCVQRTTVWKTVRAPDEYDPARRRKIRRSSSSASMSAWSACSGTSRTSRITT